MRRLYVTYTISDARGQIKKKQFQSLLPKAKLGAVYVADCYTIDAKLNSRQLEKAKTLLANPLMQNVSAIPYTLNPKPFSYAIEIGFLPGVTDNVGNTAKETIMDGAKVKFKPGQNVYFSQVFFISGKFSGADAKKIAASLHNPLIQRAAITSFADFQKYGLTSTAPKVKLSASSKVARIDLNVSDEELAKLGKLGILEPVIPAKTEILKKDSGSEFATTQRRGPLALSLNELKTIREHFNKLGRKPTDVELETLAQTWSEHCKHTIFSDPMDELKNGIYKTYIKAATEAIRAQKRKRPSGDFCVSVFTDNAGGIIFDKDHVLCHKVETHNTPSALDPFGGSVTGIVGVNRDVLGFGLGAKPVANFYGFCLADPKDKTELYRSNPVAAATGRYLPKEEGQRPPLQPNDGKMLSAARIMQGVVAGINAGGNQSGIPTPLGFFYFDPSFRGKPLVFAGTLGLIPKIQNGRKLYQKQAKSGDLIVMIGGRVGADGIHGATFSSEGLDTHSPATAVQIGDPITQKKLSDAIVKEARAQNLYNSITDCGAGGLSSAIGEMAEQSGGCLVNLDKVPLKYPGLQPWQIWISESQERMILSVPKNKWHKFQKLMKARGVEAAAIGEFNQSGKCHIRHGKNLVMDTSMEFLHNGRPKTHLKTEKPQAFHPERSTAEPRGLLKRDLTKDTLALLQNLNITSTEFASTQYDHEVQGSSVIKPLQGRGKVNGEASVFRPVLTSKKAAVVSYGLAPNLSELNPYVMAQTSIDSAIRAAVAAGANVDYMALLDNFCWSSPEDPARLWQLKEAARGAYEAAVDFGTPFISGKDSMHNDFKGYDKNGQPLKISIPPTLLISAVSVVPTAEKTISIDAKLPGDLLYILGETNNELAGSEYANIIFGVIPNLFRDPKNRFRLGGRNDTLGTVPKVNAIKNHLLYQTFYDAAQKDLIASAISVNRGGLAVALCKMLIAGGLGAKISLRDLPGDWRENFEALFSESQGRILASVNPKKAKEFENVMHRNIFGCIGKITGKPMLVVNDKNDRAIAKLRINQALKSYKGTFKDY